MNTLSLLMHLFRGDPDRHARMWVDRLGRRGYAPVDAPLDEAAWRSHLEGQRTLAVALSHDGRLHSAVIDVDLSRPCFVRVKENPGALLAALEQAHVCAAALARAAGRLGLDVLLEDSGQKGRHVWFFFETPASARDVHRLLRRVVETAEPVPEDISIDLIPSDTRVPAPGGPLVTLPLGIHLQSGRRSRLLEPSGRVIRELEPVLRRVHPCSAGALQAALTGEELTGATSEPEPLLPVEARDARVAAVLSGCPVAAHLVEKAAAIAHLRHRERLMLLHVFGHLGPEGAAFLHRVIERCADYDRSITERYLARLKESPVSCARVREWLPEVTTRVPCCCRFEVPAGAWPTPVLHALPLVTEAGGAIVRPAR